MLAAIREFLHPWQFIPLAFFIIGWIGGGSWLLLRALKRLDYPKRIRFSNCVGITILAGVTGAITGAVFYRLVSAVGSALDASLMLPGAIAALVVMVMTALFVIYAMLDLSFVRALRAAFLPMLALLILGGVVGAAAGIPAVQIRRTDIRRKRCQQNLIYIALALSTYQRNTGLPAPSLQTLIEENVIDPQRLICPAAPANPTGYIYHPTRITDADTPTTHLLLCDRKGNHPGGRNVVYADAKRQTWYTTAEFQALLAGEANADFADTLRAAETP